MRKLSLTFAQEIADELGLLCGDMPKRCRKQSELGWSSNERILLVRENRLEYYTLHPGFRQEDVSSIKKKYFKYSIPLNMIHEVNFLPKNKIKKTHLEVLFPSSKKSSKHEETDRVKEGNGNEEEEHAQVAANADLKMERWLFEFQFDLKQYIEEKMELRKNQQRNLTKIAPPSPVHVDVGLDSNVSVSQNKVQKNIEQYVNSVQRIKQMMKMKAEMAQQQAMRQMRKKQKELAQLMSSKNQSEQTFSISSFWREYFKFYQLTIKNEKSNDRKKMILKIEDELALLRQIQYFNSVAVKIAQNYVLEKNAGYDSPKKEFEHFEYYQGLWLKVGGKELNQQFLVNYYLNDIIYSLRTVKGFKLRLPLMSLIEYKGRKLLCMCDMPFSELQKTQIYNLMQQGYDLQIMSKLKECLQILEDVLNVKSTAYEIDSKKKILAPLGPNLKIFQYTYKKDKSQDQITLPNFHYIINPGIVFPIDINYQHNQGNLMARLRPELVAFFRNYSKLESPQLLAQAFMKTSLSEQIKRNEQKKVGDAAQLIANLKIPELVDMLNSVTLMFVDSYSIKSVLQQMGINIRYLRLIYESTQLQYVQEIILVDLLARTIKRQFRQALIDMENELLINQQNQYRGEDQKQKEIRLRGRKDYVHEQYKQMALDYLNLVFGCGDETRRFWTIIDEDCKLNYQISTSYPPNCKPGCLLNAVLWHCGLNLVIKSAMPLFESERPFAGFEEIEFVAKVKTYDFPSFQIQKMFRGAPSLQQKLALQLFKQSSQNLLRMQLLFNNQLSPYNFSKQVSLAKLNNYQPFLAKPNIDNSLHPVLIPFYLSNKSQYNFTKALDLMKFSLPDTHPLYITLYEQYADVFQPKIMKKTAVLMAVKCFGEFHSKTTELYSKYYHEGFNEYYLKAKRVKNIEACSIICLQMFNNQMYESCLNYCMQQIRKINDSLNEQKLGTGNFRIYMDMLLQGLDSSIYNAQLQKGILISKEVSRVISSFKLKDDRITQALFRKTLVIHMRRHTRKYFLYKIVLFVIYVRSRYEKLVIDSQECVLPCEGQERQKILDGISNEYFERQNHSNWIQWILAAIDKSFQYFNYLEDLFNGYQQHLKRYNNEDFMAAIGYLDLLIRLFGQKIFKEMLYDVKLH